MNPQNEKQKSTGQPVNLNVNPVRPNLADSSMNQDIKNLEDKPNEHDPEKEYIAGEQEGDFPPDIKMNNSSDTSKNQGSEFGSDEGTVGQQSLKDQQNRSNASELPKQ